MKAAKSFWGRSAPTVAAAALVILAGLASPVLAKRAVHCGNGFVDPVFGEQCDGSNLNGQTCTSVGFGGGTLSCSSSCKFNTSGCFTCGNGTIEDGEQCDGSNLNGQSCSTQGFAGGTLACGSGCEFDTTGCNARFVDNGDGTITDKQTALVWEQKTDDGSVHDKDNTYTWSSGGSAPDGTAFTTFLTTLNGGAIGVGNCTSGDGSAVSGGFAGHCDWRLPQIDELKTIIDCGSGSPCIDPIFGPTVPSVYRSATTYSFDPGSAWSASFSNDNVFFGVKSINFYVRAVRGGSN